MNKIVVLMLLCNLWLAAFSQKDEQAAEILKQASEKSKTFKGLHTNFEFLVENVQNETKETYKGELWAKGNKFKMTLDETETYCDSKTRWVYLVEANEVNVSNIESTANLDPEERFLNDPLSLYTLYESGFKYIIVGDQTIEGKSYTVIDLTPEDLTKPYFKVKCWISADFDYYAIKYFQKDGTRITLQLLNFDATAKLKDTDFVFKPENYPNIEVIDLRD